MNEDFFKMAQIENMVTIVVTGAVILGLATIFHSWHCMWGLALLINLNTIKGRKAN